jgi:protein-S-isoprenylcysteine O-methyltransferase Ste14
MSQTKIARRRPPVVAEKKNIAKPLRPTNASPAGSTRLHALDVLERLLVMSFYVWFFWRFGSVYLQTASWLVALVLVSESVSVCFLLTRRPATTISASKRDWVLALGTTLIPFLVVPVQAPLEPAWLGAVLLVAGMCWQLSAKFVLGRSFGLVPANRGVRCVGPYRFVRHPMYAGYLVCHLGALSLNPSLWNVGVYTLCWSLQIPRLLCEEKHLGKDAAYREYQGKVRFRLIPGVF